jgi:hypothetical protein
VFQAEQRLAPDCLQPTLVPRSGFRQQVKAGVLAGALRAPARMRRSLRSQPGPGREARRRTRLLHLPWRPSSLRLAVPHAGERRIRLHVTIVSKGNWDRT